MSLQDQVMTAMKAAMKEKNATALTALRAIKSGILLLQTEGGNRQEIAPEEELKLLQKLVKQRKDSAAIYLEQGRNDLAEPELAEIEVIAQFLPAEKSAEEIEAVVKSVIADLGASGMQDMGRVMGAVSAKLAGAADGKTVASIVKSWLS
jgi:uncharacterized protein YqeY